MDLSRLWLLENAASTPYALEGDKLIAWLHVFMVVLFVGWGAFFLYCLLRFRAKGGRTAQYTPIKAKASKYLEIGVVVVEAGLLIGISIPAWNAYKSMPTDEAVTEVRIVGQQFAWHFHYPGPDGTFGRASEENYSAANPLGIGDDQVWGSRTLRVPVGKTVLAHITSLDVIHSVGIPQLRVKQDAIPGMSVPIWFTPAKVGEYEIVCSQLCGSGHYRMGGVVQVMEQADYDAWLKQEYDYALGEGWDGEPEPAEPPPPPAEAPADEAAEAAPAEGEDVAPDAETPETDGDEADGENDTAETEAPDDGAAEDATEAGEQ
jgi:cytochrome c oxidase subunit II